MWKKLLLSFTCNILLLTMPNGSPSNKNQSEDPVQDAPVIVVTGASQGIGASVARWLGKIGARVTLIARSKQLLNQVAGDVERLGGNPLPISMDVADAKACRRSIGNTIEQFGRLDALVNNAGIFEPMATVARADPDAWQYNIQVNLLGPVYMTMAAIAELHKQNGRLINVSSGAANRVIESGSAYCAAKAALNHFTRVLATEEPALTAIAVRPGVVDTQMQALLRSKGPREMRPEQAAHYQNLKTIGKLEPPHVPARTIAWLGLYAPHDLSGMFLDYDDPRISKPALNFFGDVNQIK
ncbi:MAG: SDR family NAD(P)-dependent oxidoreductase [Planctomycetota bacterium]|jgi:NAD(P)-dependent dehydrogenase (short-subunit alcohol dehydrogenase family)